MLLGLLALIVLSNLSLTSLAGINPNSPAALTSESVLSLISKGDRLYEAANHSDKLEPWLLVEEVYFRAWLQAEESDLPSVSYKYALAQMKTGDSTLSNKDEKNALTSYLVGLAVATYPTLKYKEAVTGQAELNKNLQERVNQVISTMNFKSVDDHIARAQALTQQGHTISALGQYITAQQLIVDDPRIIQGIQETLTLIDKHRRYLNKERDSIWVKPNEDAQKLVKYLMKKVKYNWAPPVFSKDYSGTVMFKVNLDGTLSDITIKESSKNIDFDASMIRAVEKTSPISKKITTKALGNKSSIHVLEKFDYQIIRQSQSTFF
jgi:TonB family protein